MSTVVELRIFSPRLGHEDTYTFTLDHDSMEINMQARTARCRWRDNLDPEWSGKKLRHIFESDSIYPPAIFQGLVEYAWKEWRNDEIDDDQVQAELNELATWLNAITRARPETKFWKNTSALKRDYTKARSPKSKFRKNRVSAMCQSKSSLFGKLTIRGITWQPDSSAYGKTAKKKSGGAMKILLALLWVIGLSACTNFCPPNCTTIKGGFSAPADNLHIR